MSKDIAPIPCSVYDQLELHSIRNDLVEVTTDRASHVGQIVDLTIINSQEAMVLENAGKATTIFLAELLNIEKVSSCT